MSGATFSRPDSLHLPGPNWWGPWRSNEELFLLNLSRYPKICCQPASILLVLSLNKHFHKNFQSPAVIPRVFKHNVRHPRTSQIGLPQLQAPTPNPDCCSNCFCVCHICTFRLCTQLDSSVHSVPNINLVKQKPSLQMHTAPGYPLSTMLCVPHWQNIHSLNIGLKIWMRLFWKRHQISCHGTQKTVFLWLTSAKDKGVRGGSGNFFIDPFPI